LFPGHVPFNVTADGVRPQSKEIVVHQEKDNDIFGVKTYPVSIEIRNAKGELIPFSHDAIRYGVLPVPPKIRGTILSARFYLPKSHDPGTHYF
ncbi:MAG: hypothetical protein QF886_16240, partial [Planctomycetota bacterium]|nr:hypothetical protein [Planctomycetota bacterium]